MTERNGSHSSLALHDAGSQINGATNDAIRWLNRGWSAFVASIVAVDCARTHRLVVVENADAYYIKKPRRRQGLAGFKRCDLVSTH